MWSGASSAHRTPTTASFLLLALCGIYALWRYQQSPHRLLHTSLTEGGSTMTFEEMLDHALAMLQRRGRLTYRTLQRQFHLDDGALTDLKDALLYAHHEVHDDAGRGLVW